MNGVRRVGGITLVLLLAGPLKAQVLYWLGTLGGDRSVARGIGVTETSLVVVGGAMTGTGLYHAFRWDPYSGMTDLDTSSSVYSEAHAVSQDGRIIVGGIANQVGSDAVRWIDGTIQYLGRLGGLASWAEDISADGGTIVGWSTTDSSVVRAFLWRDGDGMIGLGTFGGSESEALGISPGGGFVVGWAETGTGEMRAFRWDSAAGMIDLGVNTLFGGSRAFAVSDSGTVVVGKVQVDTFAYHAFRWVQGVGFEDLGTFGGANSVALDVSADGGVVVGWAEISSGDRRAFLWTERQGMVDLTLLYGYLLPPGSWLTTAEGVSPDGRYVVGEGYNAETSRYEAFLLDRGSTVIQEGTASFRKRQIRMEVHNNRMKLSGLPREVSISVVDAIGRKVYVAQSQAPHGVAIVDLSNLATGVYRVVITGQRRAIALPVIITK